MGICSSKVYMNKHVHYIDVNTNYVLFFLSEKWRVGVVRESIKRKHLIVYENDDCEWKTIYLLKKNVTYVGTDTWNYYKEAVCKDIQQTPPVSPSSSVEE